jgi:5'-phosphate synthase pdxT subunit
VSAVGILAVQGDFAKHAEALARLGAEARLVKRRADLAGVARLVLPGGESTVLSKFLAETGLADEVAARAGAGDLALFGTCAGAIVLGKEPAEGPPPAGRQPLRLGLADVEVRRNAYGRQIDSFRAPLEAAPDLAAEAPLEGVFIRAPRLGRLGPRVEVLARAGGEPVLVREGRVLLATFHPELTPDPRVHRYFLERV